eukprot:TRINITY_DN2459_c0_g1_i3.p3 TRINITY_DN2459_c0_g1~~TRINITY_DN2459_c0_g1_i3.p3  ORF type:complete len:155 (+),score=66.81 TRINITY_DN2459_c0_g1_i3:113-577(+)
MKLEDQIQQCHDRQHEQEGLRADAEARCNRQQQQYDQLNEAITDEKKRHTDKVRRLREESQRRKVECTQQRALTAEELEKALKLLASVQADVKKERESLVGFVATTANQLLELRTNTNSQLSQLASESKRAVEAAQVEQKDIAAWLESLKEDHD